MGTEILLTAEERGAFNTTVELIKNAMNGFSLSFDEVCEKLKIKDKEKYRNFIIG